MLLSDPYAVAAGVPGHTAAMSTRPTRVFSESIVSMKPTLCYAML